MFGAHFPLDVLVGAVLGYEFGLFAARLMASARLLPAAERAYPALEELRLEHAGPIARRSRFRA